ncbi:hypothetical protein EWM64_g759 [Hericium alpestre]|uniref:FAD/NAD(P)-binding domain-containing protein n=1 Tax=Hericium alpestre TaxID=135208 RepID=A0A4Z0AA98_9AGAM|nr:hypothetical protein EWM64_g759 [Hericium alpestre]
MDGEGDFDVVILGTGLTESITAAALSKAGFRVAHIDENSYYGGDQASLTLEELAQWADRRSTTEHTTPFLAVQRERFTSIVHSQEIPDHAREYSVSLLPSLIPSLGPLISSLIASGVARYGGYRLLERVGVYDPAVGIKSVPSSKEDIFKAKDMSLVHKRRLMRFLMFASGEFEDKAEFQGQADIPFVEFLRTKFSLEQQTAETIAYALAFCGVPSDPTQPALGRLRDTLRSSGRYGTSPFLVGHYGGLGEIAQGFCRVAAVNGGIYILGRQVQSVIPPECSESSPTKYTFNLNDFPEPLTADILISSPDLLPEALRATSFVPSTSASAPSHSVARCVAIIDQPVAFPPAGIPEPVEEVEPSAETEQSSSNTTQETHVDTSVVVFPPSSLEGGSSDSAAHAFVTGQGSMSAPEGKYIVYISLPIIDPQGASAEESLKPYLDALLRLAKRPSDDASSLNPLFTLFYIQHPFTSTNASSPSSQAQETPTCLVTPPSSVSLNEASDSASVAAESLFFKAIEVLKAKRPDLWKVEEGETSAGSAGDCFQEITTLWPPLEKDPDEDAEEW